jgi:hypothetical protein
MQPDTHGRGMRWLGPLAGPLDRFLSGGRSSDPLYLSNQTFWQKSVRVLLVVFPLVVVTILVALSSFQLIKKRTVPVEEVSPAEVAARSLPNFAEAIVASAPVVSVLDAELKTVNDERILTGRIVNNTDRRFAEVQVVFNTTNSSGSQLAPEEAKFTDLGPRGQVPFVIRVKSPEAVFAIVRHVIAQ